MDRLPVVLHSIHRIHFQKSWRLSPSLASHGILAFGCPRHIAWKSSTITVDTFLLYSHAQICPCSQKLRVIGQKSRTLLYMYSISSCLPSAFYRLCSLFHYHSHCLRMLVIENRCCVADVIWNVVLALVVATHLRSIINPPRRHDLWPTFCNTNGLF